MAFLLYDDTYDSYNNTDNSKNQHSHIISTHAIALLRIVLNAPESSNVKEKETIGTSEDIGWQPPIFSLYEAMKGEKFANAPRSSCALLF